MKIHPTNQKAIEATPGLNNALIKLLTVSNQVSADAKSALTSSSVTINDLSQYYASVLFGRKYVSQNANQVVSESVVLPPAKNANSVDAQTVTVQSVETQTDEELPHEALVVDTQTEKQQENVNDDIVQSENAANQQADELIDAQTSPDEITQEELLSEPMFSEVEGSQPVSEEIEKTNSQVSERLLTLIRMYKEHVENKDRDFIADETHYGHLKHFPSHLSCLVDKKCDFEHHLLSVSQGQRNQRPQLEKYMLQNTNFKADLTNPSHLSNLDFVNAVVSSISNDDIKAATSNWLNNNQASLTNFENNKWPGINNDIQSKLSDIKATFPVYQNLSSNEFLAILNEMNNQYRAKVDEEFNANGLSQKAQELTNERNGIQQMHDALKNTIPVDGPLELDFQSLLARLNYQISVFSNAQAATPEQLENAKNHLKNAFQRNINGVDPETNAKLIQGIANNTDAILKSDFGKSLNPENLNFIIHKSISALHTDLDQFKSNNKASGFLLDKADLQKVTDDVLNELKIGREGDQKIVLNLVDFHKEIQELNKLHSAAPNSQDQAKNAADILISYDNYVYQALNSDEFYKNLNGYVSKYYDVYIAHMKPLDPFVDYSAVFKTFTAGLNNPNALGNTNKMAARVLFKSCGKIMQHLREMSDQDKLFFRVLNHLIAEWSMSSDPNALVRKLDSMISGVQGRKVESIQTFEIPEKHLQFAIFDQAKTAIATLIENFGKGTQAASGLGQTIGEGQDLANKVASSFQVSDLTSNASNSASTGLIGGVKDKVKSWLKWRNLEIHYGLMDTIDSVKNLYNDITEAKKTADQLKQTFESGKNIADGAKSLVQTFAG